MLSLGSNLGDPRAHLRAAVALLAPCALSSVWLTAPVGGVAQADFLNLVAFIEADATQAWELAQQAEDAARRVRTVRWGPRTLDVDVVLADPPVPAGLCVPHPRAHERAFVLAPWCELDPGADLPGHGSVAALLAGFGGDGLRRLGPL